MFRVFRRGGIVSVSSCLIVLLSIVTACEKDAEEAEKFPSTGEPLQMQAGELTTFQLANGITVYLQEEHSRPEIAVEVLYHAGVFDEYPGKAQLSRLVPHMLIFSPTAKFDANEAVQEIKKIGQINGDINGLLTHFDYIVSAGNLEAALDVEVERLTSVRFTPELLERYARKCVDDLNTMRTKASLSLTEYGMMAFNQAYYHGKTSIPIENGVYNLTLKDLERFHKEHYALDEMVIVVIGDFDSAEATRLIERKFESIERDAAPEPDGKRPAGKDVNAQWDIPEDVIILTFPGPYENDRARLALTLFGTFLNRELSVHDELQMSVRSAYCSNHIFPVKDIPFFVFAEPRRGRNLQDVRSSLIFTIDEVMQKVSEGVFDAMKANLIRFCESTMLNTPLKAGGGVTHYQVIGQEALNVGLRHYLREGRSTEEFIETVRSLTFEESKGYVRSYLTLDNMKTIAVTGTE